MLERYRFIPMRHLIQTPWRSLAVVIGIMCGVSLFVAIDTVGDATLRSFDSGVTAMAGKSGLTVTGPEAGFPADRLNLVSGVDGVERGVPSTITSTFCRVAGTKEPGMLLVHGIVPVVEEAIDRYRSVGSGDGAGLRDSLKNTGSILLGKDFAGKYGIAPGTRVELLTATGIQTRTVEAFFTTRGVAAGQPGNLALMRLDEAGLLYDRVGQLDRIDILPRIGENLDELALRVSSALGPGYLVSRPESQANDLRRMVGAYHAMLRVLSGLAMLVGCFVMASSASFSINQRAGEIRTLRCVGASRSTIIALVISEFAFLGFVGSLLGIFSGHALARALVDMIARSISQQFVMPIRIGELYPSMWRSSIMLLTGTLLSTAAAILPAWRASRLPPIQVQAGDHRPGSWMSYGASARFYGIGISGLLLSAAAAFWSARAQTPMSQTLASQVGVVSALAAGPFVVTLLLLFVRRLIPPSAAMLRLACDGLLRNPGRTASNARNVFVGLLLITVISTLQTSFQTNLERWLDKVLYIDLIVFSGPRLFFGEMQPLDPSVAEWIGAVPGVDSRDGRGAMGVRFAKTGYEGRMIGIKAFDSPHPALASLPFDLIESRPVISRGNIFQYDQPSALVSVNFSSHFGRTTGDDLVLDSPTGKVSLRILGLVNEFSSPEGTVYMTRELYSRYWGDNLVSFFAAFVEPGLAVPEVAQRINDRLGRDHGIIALDQRQVRQRMQEMLDESFSYIRAVEIAALLVGFLGLLNALTAGVLWRTREFGVLRALGITRAGLCGIVILEGILLGSFASLAAVGYGVFAGALVLRGVLTAQMGWPLTLHVPFAVSWALPAAGVLIGALAGAVPALRVNRISPREALASE